MLILFYFILGVLTELKTDPTTGLLYPDSHRVRITLDNANLEQEIWVPFMAPSLLTVDRIMV